MRLAVALAGAGLLHVLLFVMLHVRPGPRPAPAVDVVPYIEATEANAGEATDVQLATGAPGAAPAAASPIAHAVATPAGPTPAAPAIARAPDGVEPSAPVGTAGTEGRAPSAGQGGAVLLGPSTATGPGAERGTGAETGAGVAQGADVFPRLDRSASLAQILARVRAARRYPEAARRRELEGVVRVHFNVGADGRPRDISASDGDALLQQAAVEAVERAAPLPFVDGPLDVDVDYRLDATR